VVVGLTPCVVQLEPRSSHIERHRLAVRVVRVPVVGGPLEAFETELATVDDRVVARSGDVAVEARRDRLVRDHAWLDRAVLARVGLVALDAEHVVDVPVGEDGRVQRVGAPPTQLVVDALVKAGKDFDLLTLPGDIPLVEPDDVRHLVSVHCAGAERGAGAFTIVPARDELGSNAVLCSPAGAVPLRFGDNSFFPHLDAAKGHGIEPEVVHLPRIALDIDTPEDLALFLRTPSPTRAHALLQQWRIRLDVAGAE